MSNDGSEETGTEAGDGVGGAYQVCAADDKMLYSVSDSSRQGEGERYYLEN